ncbi:MAG: DUF3592 domain-containing protein [Cellvibrio sp.]|uniref:DUF3592 domain-containing protein n=1 Tax=Cellvibrio sp. TaxID=1965322 RepID=UPI00272363B0|nr:DUF3592 domain-containing protein [Cellvibrio sp.]
MNITYFLVSLGFLLFCIYMLHHALINHRNAKASNGWVTTTGKLTELHLWGKRRVDGDMVDCENLSVKYQYEVNGKAFTGKRAAFYTLHYPETVDFAKRYPQGSTIPVMYNPQNPVESVIVPGLHPLKPNSEIWLAGVGVVIMSATVLGVFIGELK